MKEFIQDLKEQIEGEVYSDAITCHVYSVDASIFEITPLAVVLPKTREDLIRAVKIAYQHQIPITPRGAATGITGGCLGQGLVIDTSKYLNRLIKIATDSSYVICEPGVIQEQLNDHLAPYGYRLGPDTSTGNRATLGGMLANNAAGSRSLKYGSMVDHVQSVEIVLSTGELVQLGPITKEAWEAKRQLQTMEGHLYRSIWQIKNTYAEEIEKRFPKIPRRVSGYNLDQLIKNDDLNLAKLIVGSEGTLGIVTQMKLNIVPKAQHLGLCLLYFDDLLVAMRRVPELLQFHPTALEMIDDQIIELGRTSPSLRNQLEWLTGHPKAILIVEIEGKSSAEVTERLEIFKQYIQQNHIGYKHHMILELTAMRHVWALRKAGLGILLSKRTYSRAIAFLEDIAVPPHRLADFMESFLLLLEKYHKKAGIYGHVGAGCMHIRPYVNLQSAVEIQHMHQMMLETSQLLIDYGGTLSGEHGDGLIRSWLNPTIFGEKIMQAFQAVKQAFDPANLMNPGKIVMGQLPPLEEWRLSPASILQAPDTFLNFEPEGGFALAVDLCNGNGQCRKREGVMCPSFQVTNEEFHSTRARAQALRAIIHGRLPQETFLSQGMHDILDLCISCKGCKTECPSQVDMAKMKAEFLYHYQEKHGYPLRSYLFGYIGAMNQWMSPMAALFNQMMQSSWFKKALSYLKISPQRPLPLLARQRFSKWLKQDFTCSPFLNKQVVLFNDTYTEFNEPQIGQAAIQLLQALGYSVLVPPWSCCGRPLMTKGLLKQARKYAERVIEILAPYAQKGLTIIGLEPSCLLTIKDDYASLLSPQLLAQGEIVAQHSLLLDEFLALHIGAEFSSLFREERREVKIHGHCHQKALVGMKPTLDVLQSIPGFKVSEIPSGCCGMAGSFGYEKEHYSISLAIGELHLFPAIRASSPQTLFVANGTSCRHQIADATSSPSLHLAEVLFNQLKTRSEK